MPDHPEIYRSQAEGYEALVSREDHLGNLLPAIQKIASLSGKKVVEFGAGTGRLTCQMAPLVEKWKQNQLPQGLQAKIKQPNAVQLPLSHTNTLGEVYVLPQDKMPMLKPFTNGANPMPGTLVQQEESNSTKVGKIPNAIPVQPYTFQRGNQRK